MKTPILIVVFSIFCVKNILAQNTTIAGFFPTIDHSGALSNRFSYNSYLFGAIKPYSSTEGSSRALYLLKLQTNFLLPIPMFMKGNNLLKRMLETNTVFFNNLL